MNHDEKLVTDYKVWKNEEEIINASIISEVRRESKLEGIKEGTAQTKKEMVLNMHKDNLPLDLISKCTGLSENEIEKIVNSIKE